MSIYQDFEQSDRYYGYSNLGKRGRRKANAKPGEHIPNSKEAKVLRRLKSQTGLSEAEIRTHRKYNVMLSEAQKSPHTAKPKEEDI